MTIEADDFANWLEHPITAKFMTVLKAREQFYKDTWISISWDGETADTAQLANLRGCATTIAWAYNLGLEDLFPKEAE